MCDYLSVKNIIEKKSYIKEIPTIIFRPPEASGLYPTILLYYGWGSDKEAQRFRAFILSTLGYQVVIPEAINHGERNPIDHLQTKEKEKYFWNTILTNIDESEDIIGELIRKYKADPYRIGVVGNSMGGFTASGVFTHNPSIKTSVIFKGSCAWKHTNQFFKKSLGNSDDIRLSEIKRKVSRLDPVNNLQKIIDRHMLILHGDSDNLVPIKNQKIFYNKIKPLYRNKNIIKLIEYPDVSHVVTTGMMEECINWLHMYL